MICRLLLVLIISLPMLACNSGKAPDSSNTSEDVRQAERVPEQFRHLLPMAQRWGIGDDTKRSGATSQAMPSEKQALVDAVGPYRPQINAWIDTYGQKPMPDEAAAFMYMLLAMEEMGI